MPRVKYENTFFQTFGELPTIGSHAPDVSLVNTKLQNVTLANWTGMRKVMNIFVSIDRPVCATSVTKFDKFFDGIEDVAALMVSYDLPFAHARFAEQNEVCPQFVMPGLVKTMVYRLSTGHLRACSREQSSSWTKTTPSSTTNRLKTSLKNLTMTPHCVRWGLNFRSTNEYFNI
jgi:peroxiredoxin